MGRKKKSDKLGNTALIALPKLVDERVGEGVSLIVVGWLASGVFLCGALPQLAMGHLRRFRPRARRHRADGLRHDGGRLCDGGRRQRG